MNVSLNSRFCSCDWYTVSSFRLKAFSKCKVTHLLLILENWIQLSGRSERSCDLKVDEPNGLFIFWCCNTTEPFVCTATLIQMLFCPFQACPCVSLMSAWEPESISFITSKHQDLNLVCFSRVGHWLEIWFRTGRERSHSVWALAGGQAERSELFEGRLVGGGEGGCGTGEDGVEPWLK